MMTWTKDDTVVCRRWTALVAYDDYTLELHEVADGPWVLHLWANDPPLGDFVYATLGWFPTAQDGKAWAEAQYEAANVAGLIDSPTRLRRVFCTAARKRIEDGSDHAGPENRT